MKKTLFLLFLPLLLNAQWQLKVAPNKQSLSLNGKPFFWLGDTDWELFHRLNRAEVTEFIQKRAAQGYNVLQVVALAEFDGLKQPNRQGDIPLIDLDPTKMAITNGSNPANDQEYDYWDHVDFVLEEAAKHKVFIAILPTWGDKVAHLWGEGPIIFNEANARIYGENIAKRFSKHKNIIWMMGGDRAATYTNDQKKQYDDRPVWRAMAEGIIAGDKAMGVPRRFMTYHTMGGSTGTSDFIHDEPWLDMNSYQSGHGSREAEIWNWIEKDVKKEPKKPTIDLEPCYEDHPINPWDGKWTRARGYFTAFDVRVRIYRGVIAGGAGVTYGHHHIWQFLNTELNPPVNVGDTLIAWQKAIYAPAATQMIHLKKLFEPLMNDTRMLTPEMILSNKGSNYKDLVLATAEQHYKYAMVHLPFKQKVTLDLDKFKKMSLRIDVFDPKTGKIVESKTVNKGKIEFEPQAKLEDYLLIIK
jgi:Protein of unknown function (DUF4038)/Putative collagen-binding domain of a collagenase